MNIYLSPLLLLMALGACVKNESASLTDLDDSSPFALEANDTVLTQDNILSDNEYYLTEEKLSQIIDFELGDTISLDNPMRFLQISILFTLEQNSNYYYIAQKQKNDEEVSDFLNQKRESFYKNLGITEEAYINYGIAHAEEIQEFLATNEEFSIAYELSQSQVTD